MDVKRGRQTGRIPQVSGAVLGAVCMDVKRSGRQVAFRRCLGLS